MVKNGIKNWKKRLKENKFEIIYELVKLIPEGRATSYGAIAECLGTKGGARLVGWAMHALMKNHEVPAHRVVNRNGVLSGKNAFDTPSKMQELLESEGVEIVDDKIVNFQQVFWNPSKELL